MLERHQNLTREGILRNPLTPWDWWIVLKTLGGIIAVQQLQSSQSVPEITVQLLHLSQLSILTGNWRRRRRKRELKNKTAWSYSVGFLWIVCAFSPSMTSECQGVMFITICLDLFITESFLEPGSWEGNHGDSRFSNPCLCWWPTVDFFNSWILASHFYGWSLSPGLWSDAKALHEMQ